MLSRARSARRFCDEAAFKALAESGGNDDQVGLGLMVTIEMRQLKVIFAVRTISLRGPGSNRAI